MAPIISLLIVISLSILSTRIATVALIHTGLSRELARFQARSAFTGVGFTTTEAENVVRHPVRRRIVMILMLLGNVGIISAITSLILTFVGEHEKGFLSVRAAFLIGGLLLLWLLASSGWIDRHLSVIISMMLKRYTRLDVRDYASLLHLAEDYRVTELSVKPDDWVANRTLSECNLRDEGVMVLGVVRQNGDYLGAPRGKTEIFPEDTMILYGRASILDNIDRRVRGAQGDIQHQSAVKEQKRVSQQENARDEADRGQD
jgi:hypothetical protein